jgi:3-hydroxyisobutyrate dehydrogenase
MPEKPSPSAADHQTHGAPTPHPRIGFIGTGLIGTPMVERLLERGLRVSIWNRTAAKLAPLVALGAEHEATAADVARKSDIVCLCLTNTDAVREVVFGSSGIADALTAHALVVDLSSIDPEATVSMAAALAARSGARWIDAPVSGGLPAARAGRLIVFAGGTAADIARADPVFAALATRVTHMGGQGAGQLAKSCNQMIVACNLMVIAEMLAFGRAVGIDSVRLPDALAGGFADSLPLQIFGRRMADGVDTPRIGALATFRKDIDQVVRLGAAYDATVPVSTCVAALYRAAGEHQDIGTDADVSRLIHMFAGPLDSAAASRTPA